MRYLSCGLLLLGIALPVATSAQCVGDCNNSGTVLVNELIIGVNIDLGLALLSQCDSFDRNHDGTVTVGDLVVGVNNALNGCAGTPTGTPTATATLTHTPASTPTMTPIQTGDRFVDNGDGTITDSQTGLIWEKKDQGGGLHDTSTSYLWSGFCSDGSGNYCQPDAAAATTCNAVTGGTAECAQCAGTATCKTSGFTTIWDWLNQLNAASFAGHSDWRIPTVGQNGDTAQLETIFDPSVSGCTHGAPCVPPAFDAGCTGGCTVTSCSCTQINFYWSATDADNPRGAWVVTFFNGFSEALSKTNGYYLRAVRGGS